MFYQTLDLPLRHFVDEIFVGYHTNMRYECIDGLADTVTVYTHLYKEIS